MPIAPSLELESDEKQDTMISLDKKKEKKSDEANAFSKFWNWATQLF